MTGEADEAGRNRSPDNGPGRVGIALRLLLVGGAVAVGLLWILRLVIAGPGLTDGLLFELLAPLLILYLAVRYFSAQTANIRALRDRRDES